MNNPQRAAVNQQLYFAKLHLAWLEQALDDAQLPARVVEQSLCESTVFHLNLAYRFYLAEIATAYARPCQSLECAQALEHQLTDLGFDPAELKEIQQLEVSGWLAELLDAQQSIVNGVGGAVKSSSPVLAIPTLQLPSGGLDASRCQSFLESLQALMDSQRGHLEEW